MTDNVGYTPGSGADVAADDVGGVLYQRVKVVIGADGVSDGDVSSANPLPVSLPATAATGAKQDTGNTSLASIDVKVPALGQALAASSVPVVLTAAQITTLTPYATVGVSGSVTVTGTFWQATQPVSIAATVAVSGPLTDAQLRAVAVPVSGTVTANAGSGTLAVSAASLPLPSNAAQETGGNLATLVAKDFATQTTLALIKAKTDNLDVSLSGGGHHVIVDSMPAVSAESSALVVDEDADFAVDATEALTQTESGRLRTEAAGLVGDTAPTCLVGESRPLSLGTDGRLRVTVVEAPTHMDFFIDSDCNRVNPNDYNAVYAVNNHPWSALCPI